MSVGVRLLVAALVAALLAVAPRSAQAVPDALDLDVTAPAFAGEQLIAQSDPMPTPGGRENWQCRVDFGDGTVAGSWRARPSDPFAPCFAVHTYATAGSYTVVMTVTDAEGATVTEQQQVTVTTRQVSARAGGVEGSAVTLEGQVPATTWTFAVTGTSTVCSFGKPGQTVRVTCFRDGTYRIHYDTGDAATSGGYDVTWTNGAPRPTMRATRTLVRRDGSPYYVPVRRVGTGDQVRFDVRANDPSKNAKGDPLRCVFRHGNGLRETQRAYRPQGSCNGLTSYLAPGRHTSRARVVDEDRAEGSARASVVVVRRDVHLTVKDIRRGGISGVVAAHLTPRGLLGRVDLRFPNGRRLVATRLTTLQVSSFGSATLAGRAKVDGETGYRFVLFPDRTYPQGIAFSVYAWSVDDPDDYVLRQTAYREGFRVSLHAPPVS